MRTVVALLCIAAVAGAQDPGARGAIVTVTVAPQTLTVGEPFTVRVRVRAPKVATIRFPVVPDSGDAIEAVDPRFVEDASTIASLDRTAVYRLVAWDVGTRTPRFGSVTVSVAGAEQAFPVNTGPVTVVSLLPADTADRVPKAVREPVPDPSGLWRYVLLGVLALIGIGWYVVRRVRRKAHTPPEPAAFDTASDAYDALDRLGLATAGEPGRHVIAHVDVLRAYVARRVPGAAASLTVPELVASLASSDFPLPPARIGTLLERDAALRFARAPISVDEAMQLGTEARAIARDVQAAYDARAREVDRGPRRSRAGKRA